MMGTRVLQVGVLVGLGLLLGAQVGLGQIQGDGSLGSLVNGSLTNACTGFCFITGGVNPPGGTNLFHSFERFSVDNGGSAYFFVDPAITNILARVTGTTRSEIFGTLGTRALIGGNLFRSPANLFLINPNGIIFGPSARLDVGASFAATTASGVRFGDQGVFSAEQGDAPPLLTVQPDAFLFTRVAPAGIEMRANAPSPLGVNGFRVRNGQRLLLLGGDVGVDGGGLFALGGRVDVGAVAEPGTVRLQGDGSLGFADGLARGTVRFEQGAVVRVDGISGGEIGVTAREIEVRGGSLLQGGIFPGLGTRDSQAGTVRLEATGTVTVAGAGSRVANDVRTGATGTGGDLVIGAREVVVRDGAQLGAVTLGTGNAGNVRISASDRVLFQGANTGASSSVETATAVGQGGDVVIEAPVLEVRDGAQLIANTRGTGDAGNVRISASDRVLFQNSSAAITRVEVGGVGQGGNVVIEAPTLEVLDGAQLLASTEGKGDAGNVQVTASARVLFQGANTYGFSIVATSGDGKGGNVLINTPILEVLNGAQLSSSTLGKGDAGNVQITASARVLFQHRSAAFSIVEASAVGMGGDIVIVAPVLEVRDGAALRANTSGTGDAGNVRIEASDRVLFQNGEAFSSVEVGGVGQGGDIVIVAPVLEVRDGAALLANTRGTGDAGNVRIEASDRVLFQNSGAAFSSVAASGVGQGGNVVINAPVLEVRDGAALVANTLGKGDAGNVLITAGDRILFQNGFALSSVPPGAVGQGGNIVIDAPVMEVRDGSQLVATTRGKGDAGNVRISAGDRVLLDGTNPITGRSSAIFTINGQLLNDGSVSAGTGRGGDVNLTTPNLQVSNGAVINASTANDRAGGDITLSLGNLSLLNGGQILSTSDGSGPAGTVRINATNGIRIAGSDPTYADRSARFTTAVAPINANSGIQVRSTATGAAGNVIIGDQGNTPRLVLDGGEIVADSNAVNGGNISLNLDQALVMRNGSLISATAGRALGAGDGGNITITAPFVLTRPGENNDIIANAFSGTGGNITITADSILNFTVNEKGKTFNQLRSQSTNDISASSDFGGSGTLSLGGLNVNPAQGTVQLPSATSIPQPTQGCETASTSSQTAKAEFFTSGRGGRPASPSDPLSSSTILDDLRLPASLNAHQPLASSGTLPSEIQTPKVMIEATHWHLDTQGRVVLTAALTPRTISHCHLIAQPDP